MGWIDDGLDREFREGPWFGAGAAFNIIKLKLWGLGTGERFCGVGCRREREKENSVNSKVSR